MAAVINPYNPFSLENYQPFLNGPVAPVVLSAPVDRFHRQSPKKLETKKHSWFTGFAKEVLINGLTIAASIAGGMFGGVVGAMAAGSLTSATLGILDQKLFKKQTLDWKSVAIDGALGLIPGSVAERLALGGGKLLTRVTGQAVEIGAKNSVKRGVIVGATDGLVMGSVGGFGQEAYDSYKKDGSVNWASSAKEGLRSMFSAVIGGGLGAGAFMRFRPKRLH